VNCGALPDHLFESELFGHTKGAYTDASTNAKGLVAEAEGGTIFLDEIDTLSPAAQVKLLRFLQNREYRVLGSPRTLRADVRIIAATNADLHQLVLNRSFRQDLYYRLKSISITIPPLRDRIEDIPSLADHFLKLLADRAKNRDLGISQGALEKMMAYCWPGNVRELEGVLQQAMLLAPAVTIEPYDIDLPETQDSRLTSACPLREAKNRAIQEFERSYLTTVLSSHRGNVSRAAKAAGKERRTFQRLLRKYGLQAKDFEGRSA
jgi:DNA-binding NtrC family response regulator